MSRSGRILTLVGFLIIIAGTAQFVVGVAMMTDFGAALSGTLGWELGNSGNPYPIGNPLLMEFAWIAGGGVVYAGIARGGARVSR
jgi:hypothetical protein